MQDFEEYHSWFLNEAPSDDEVERDPAIATHFNALLSTAPLQITVSWRGHILSLNTHKDPCTITCGTHPDSDILLDETSAPFEDNGTPWQLPLLSRHQDDWQLHLYSPWPAQFHKDHASLHLQELFLARFTTQPSVVLSLHALVEEQGYFHVQVAHLDILIERIPHHHLHPRKTTVDKEPLPYIGLSTAIHVGFLTMLLTIPVGLDRLSEQLEEPYQERHLQAFLIPPPPQVIPPQPPPTQVQHTNPNEYDLRGDGADQSIGAQHQSEEGTAGQTNNLLKSKKKQISVKQRKPSANQDAQLASKREKKALSPAHVGVIASKHGEDGDFVGVAQITKGNDLNDFTGQVQEAQLGDAFGDFGLGISGTGRGGGAKDESVGISMDNALRRVKVGGQGVAARNKHRGIRTDDLMMQHLKFKDKTYVKDAKLAERGCLGAEMVQNAIRRRRNQVRTCYEHHLFKNKNLSGKLSLELRITQNGKINEFRVLEDTTREPEIAKCVQERLSTLQFPTFSECKDVVVRYPFSFHPKQLMVLPTASKP